MDIQKIKELALANGFKLKEQADGSMDLNAYVYDFANAIEQAAKAHQAEKLKGCVVVPKSETTDWYLDEDEYIYTDEPDIFLCDLEPGDVLEVKRQQCWQAECQFAAKVYEDEDNINWELFDSKEEAEKAAAHCKAMVEEKADTVSMNTAAELVE